MASHVHRLREVGPEQRFRASLLLDDAHDSPALLPSADRFDIRVLEDEQRPEVVPGALTFRDGVVTTSAFYDQCDVVVVPTPRTAGSRLLRPAIEAMARGCVVVVDPALRDVLGDAALYLDDAPVEQVLDKLAAEPALHAEQHGRSLAFCQTVLGAEAYVAAVTTLTTTGGSR